MFSTSRLSWVERYHNLLAKRARIITRLLSSRREHSLPQMQVNPYAHCIDATLYLYLRRYHDVIHNASSRRALVCLCIFAFIDTTTPSIPRCHPYIPPCIASARRPIFTSIDTTMSRVKVTRSHIQWWSTVYGKGLNIHDRSKSSSLIDMAKWSVGPSGRWEDDSNTRRI